VSDIPPAAPEQTPAYRAAKMAVIILSVLIILAVIALIVGGIAKLAGKPKPATLGTGSTFQLAPGARILDMQSQPGRVILRIRTETGEEIDILDTSDGHLVGQVKATYSR
jgi:hypothetical protein